MITALLLTLHAAADDTDQGRRCMSIINEAVQVIRQLADDIKQNNTTADGAWDDAKDENEYRYLVNLAQRLEQHATRSFLLTRL